MRTHSRTYLPTAALALSVLLFCPALRANPAINASINVNFAASGGPYYDQATFTFTNSGSWTSQLAFCLDGNQYYSGGSGYLENAATTLTLSNETNNLTVAQEEEAAFLVSYSGVVDPGHTSFTTESNIQLAIWKVMGTLGSQTVTSTATTYYNYAMAAVTGLNAGTGGNPAQYTAAQLASLLNGVEFFTPSNFSIPPGSATNQRFIVTTPEPGTMVLLGTGVLLLVVGRIRLRR